MTTRALYGEVFLFELKKWQKYSSFITNFTLSLVKFEIKSHTNTWLNGLIPIDRICCMPDIKIDDLKISPFSKSVDDCQTYISCITIVNDWRVQLCHSQMQILLYNNHHQSAWISSINFVENSLKLIASTIFFNNIVSVTNICS